MLFLLFVQIELRIGSLVGIINRIIGLHIINPGGKMDCLIRCDNLQVTNNTLRQMDSQIRRVINKNNTELIAAEADGVIAFTNRCFNRFRQQGNNSVAFLVPLGIVDQF